MDGKHWTINLFNFNKRKIIAQAVKQNFWLHNACSWVVNQPLTLFRSAGYHLLSNLWDEISKIFVFTHRNFFLICEHLLLMPILTKSRDDNLETKRYKSNLAAVKKANLMNRSGNKFITFIQFLHKIARIDRCFRTIFNVIRWRGRRR